MIVIRSWNDFKQYGINVLTGEACAYSMRLLCDLDEDGVDIIEHFLSVKREGLADNWNTYVGEKAAIASVMISYKLFNDLAKFILLYKGYDYVITDHQITGMSAEEYNKWVECGIMGENVQTSINPAKSTNHPNVGGRNVHAFTGRIE